MLLPEKSRWLTSMGLTDLPMCPSLRRLPRREERPGDTAEPHPARRFPSRCDVRSKTGALRWCWCSHRRVSDLETKGWKRERPLSLLNLVLCKTFYSPHCDSEFSRNCRFVGSSIGERTLSLGWKLRLPPGHHWAPDYQGECRSLLHSEGQ